MNIYEMIGFIVVWSNVLWIIPLMFVMIAIAVFDWETQKDLDDGLVIDPLYERTFTILDYQEICWVLRYRDPRLFGQILGGIGLWIYDNCWNSFEQFMLTE